MGHRSNVYCCCILASIQLRLRNFRKTADGQRWMPQLMESYRSCLWTRYLREALVVDYQLGLYYDIQSEPINVRIHILLQAVPGTLAGIPTWNKNWHLALMQLAVDDETFSRVLPAKVWCRCTGPLIFLRPRLRYRPDPCRLYQCHSIKRIWRHLNELYARWPQPKRQYHCNPSRLPLLQRSTRANTVGG